MTRKILTVAKPSTGNSPVLFKTTLTTPNLLTKSANTGALFTTIDNTPKLKETGAVGINIVV